MRILIVDRSPEAVETLKIALAVDEEFKIVGAAPSRRVALARIEELRPDLVILDVEAPAPDGLKTLSAIRQSYPDLPVILHSALTHQGAEATVEALFLGATDYLPKAESVAGVGDSVIYIRERLIPKIKMFCGKKSSDYAALADSNATALPAAAPPEKAPAKPKASQPPAVVDVVVIGVSTGGPQALHSFIPKLPADFPVPILIVQHMPPLFTQSLAQRLFDESALEVFEAVTGQLLRPGCAFVAPGDYHMTVERDAAGARIVLNQDDPENSCRPSVDVLFRSVAGVFGRSTLAVVLTGMGEDGLRGCAAVRHAGGQILVQDEASSTVWGMPRAIQEAGLADKVVSLSRMSSEVVDRVMRGRPKRAKTDEASG